MGQGGSKDARTCAQCPMLEEMSDRNTSTGAALRAQVQTRTVTTEEGTGGGACDQQRAPPDRGGRGQSAATQGAGYGGGSTRPKSHSIGLGGGGVPGWIGERGGYGINGGQHRQRGRRDATSAPRPDGIQGGDRDSWRRQQWCQWRMGRRQVGSRPVGQPSQRHCGKDRGWAAGCGVGSRIDRGAISGRRTDRCCMDPRRTTPRKGLGDTAGESGG